MIVQCSSCAARYQLDSDRVPPRRIRVRCPKCSYVFGIDGSRAEELVGAAQAVSRSIPPISAAEAPAPAAPRQAPPRQAPPTPAAPTQNHAFQDIELERPSASVAPVPPPPVSQPVVDEPSGAFDLEIERSTMPMTPPAAPTLAGDSGPAAAPAAPAAAATATVEKEQTDPGDDKARRLARALVSDILVYNRDVRDKALADGNLVQSMGQEIKKSWELYKERVTPEVANSTNHFRQALNDILADGQQIF